MKVASQHAACCTLLLPRTLRCAHACSQYEKLSKRCESTKEQFSAYEQQDLRCREDLKHVNAKAKKLIKSQEQERKKVGAEITTPRFFQLDFNVCKLFFLCRRRMAMLCLRWSCISIISSHFVVSFGKLLLYFFFIFHKENIYYASDYKKKKKKVNVHPNSIVVKCKLFSTL